MLALALLTVQYSFAADCPAPVTIEVLQADLQAAEAAYVQLDLPGFEVAVERTRTALPCLGAVIPPSTAAWLHRTEGLAAFAASDPIRAEQAFGAGRRVQPAYTFPADVAPEGNPVLRH